MNLQEGLGLVGLIMAFVAPTQLFLMKQIAELKTQIANLCERIRSEETKTGIYHGAPHDLEDK